MPLKLNPAPKKLERVLVGRSEVLTPEFEQQIVKDFTTNISRNPYWFNNFAAMHNNYAMTATKADRYFKAWQNRVEQLIKGKKLKFDFLKQVSGQELSLGEFWIDTKDKKYGQFKMTYLDAYSHFLTYGERLGKIEGEVSYSFESAEAYEANKLIGTRSLDRFAVFNMKEGVITGECKIYKIVKGKENVLIETKTFKDGKVL